MALDTRREPLRHPVAVRAPLRELSLLETYRTARRNVLELIPAAAYRVPVLQGTNRFRGRWIMISDPDGMEHVLKTRAANYPRSDTSKRILSPREGESIFVAEGASWKRQHKAMAPIFQHRNLAGCAPMMTDAAEATARRLAERAGRVHDIYPDMVTATCDVIADTALSGREALDRSAITRGVTAFLDSVAKISLLDLVNAPKWIPRPARIIHGGDRQMDAMMDDIIVTRQERGPGDPPDMLDMLISARDPGSGEPLSRLELRNNLLSFIVAGHETTALALTWALYLLAFDRSAQLRARDEAQAVLGDRAATADDLPRLRFVRQVIEEGLRLYPPAGFLTRTAREADEVLGHPIEPDQSVILPIYALQRHHLLWDDPDAFDADRFAPEAVKGRHRFAYLPFGAGPRICLGMNFAIMESVIILATLVARLDVALPRSVAPQPTMTLTLRPANGMRLRIDRL